MNKNYDIFIQESFITDEVKGQAYGILLRSKEQVQSYATEVIFRTSDIVR